jgi:hypothetical protein
MPAMAARSKKNRKKSAATSGEAAGSKRESQPPDKRDDLPRATTPPGRKVPIAVYILLAIFLLLPLRYYLSSDNRDERFAWRMFSPVRIQRCEATFFHGESNKPIPTARRFHNAWLGLARRGRRNIVKAMGERLCETFDTSFDPKTFKAVPRRSYPDGVRVYLACEMHAGTIRKAELRSGKQKTTDERIEVIYSGESNYCDTGVP